MRRAKAVTAAFAHYSSAVHSTAKAGGLITRHIICTAAIATVARLSTVRMIDIFTKRQDSVIV